MDKGRNLLPWILATTMATLAIAITVGWAKELHQIIRPRQAKQPLIYAGRGGDDRTCAGTCTALNGRANSTVTPSIAPNVEANRQIWNAR